MRKILLFIWLVFVTCAATANDVNSPTTQTGPYDVVKQVSDTLIAKLQALPSDESRHAAVMAVIQTDLLPHVDTRYAAFMALGKHIKTTNKAQRKAFHQAFRAHLVTTYAAALSRFDNQSIQLAPPPNLTDSARSTSIKGLVSGGDTPAVDVFFKLRKNKKTGQWKIYDFVAEGISLLRTKTSEVSALIRAEGLEKTITYLDSGKPRDRLEQ